VLVSRRTLACLIAAGAASVVVTAASAGTPTTWDVVASGAGAPAASQELGVARTADGTLHIAWREDTPGTINSAVRTRTIAPGGSLGSVATVVSGWSVGADPTLAAGGGALRVFFPSIIPTEGLQTATAPGAGGPWSSPALITAADFVRGRTVGATTTSDGISIQTWYGVAEIVVHRGLSGGPDNVISGEGTNTRPDIVTEAGGGLEVAWCSFGGGAPGTYVRRVDPASGAGAGNAVQLPGSATSGQASCVLESEVSRREPIAARAGGGVFVAGTSGYPSLDRVLLWRLDASGAVAATLVAASEPGVSHAEPAIAAAPDGRIWLAWLRPNPSGGRTIVARRSNRAGTVLGAAVTRTAPSGNALGTINLSAQSGRVDVLGIMSTVTNEKSVRHTQMLPGLTLQRSGGARQRPGRRYAVTFSVLDAGDPVAGARVRAGGRFAATAANGRATLILRRGATRVIATKSGYVGAALSLRCC
jgi:hypothetical protein